MNRTMINSLFLMGTVLASAGCETPQSALDDDFGNAYRNMVASQIHNPDAARMPPRDPPMTMDGQRGTQVIEAYRTDGKKNGPPKPAISINLGK